MRIDDVTAVIRPRTPYEAADLGMAMVRDAGRHVWIPWFAATLPLFLLCNLAAYGLGYVWLGGVMLWWLKPLCDRVPLFVLSRRLFGETPRLGSVLRALPRLWFTGLPGAILLERLDLARSLDLPVAQLEGLKWFARGKRQRLLQRTARGPGVVLTFVCLGMEAAFFFGVWTLALMFVPFEYLPETFRALWADFMTHPTPGHQFINNLLWYLAISAVEPLYVGGGFALYLNRRTELEAWDIEIAFRRLAERLEEHARSLAAALVLALSVVMALHPSQAGAADAAPAAASAMPLPVTLDADADARLRKGFEQALKDPDLTPHEKGGHWEYRGDDAPAQHKPAPLPAWLEALLKPLRGFRDLGAAALSFLPWLIGLALLALAVRYRRWLLSWFQPFTPVQTAAPFKAQSRLVEAPEELPADVAAAAQALWSRGEARAALALLYRGSVARLQELNGRDLPQGATESDCLRACGTLPAAAAETVRRVVRAWQYAAYAHRLPDGAAFEELLGAWRSSLGAQA